MKASSKAGNDQSAKHLRELRGGAIVGLMLKAMSFGGSLLLSMVVARLLGASQAGMFFLTLTLITIVSTISRIGLDKPIVRQTAAARAVGDYEAIRSIAASCAALVAAVSTCIGAVLYVAGDLIALEAFGKPGLEVFLRHMSWSVPALAVASTVAFSFQGASQIALHLLFLSVLTPVAVLAGVALGASVGWSLPVAIWYTLGAMLTFLVALCTWSAMWGRPNKLMRWKQLQRMLTSSRSTLIVIVAQLMMTWSPVVVLGVFSASVDVANYHVATRLALLISFAMIAVNSIAAPTFAALHATGRLSELEDAVIKTTKLATLSALPIAGVLFVFPSSILILFGAEFAGATALLRVLAVGYFVSTAMGSVSNLLLMTGYEKAFRNVCVAGACMSLVVVTTGAWSYGAIGAAWAATITSVLVSLLGAVVARQCLGFTGIGWIVRRDRSEDA